MLLPQPVRGLHQEADGSSIANRLKKSALKEAICNTDITFSLFDSPKFIVLLFSSKDSCIMSVM
jgi:hypothetical protein